MESSPERLKSLKDTLLEYAVFNLDDLFIDKQMKSISSNIPIFPNYLFEKILEKSKNMCWWINQDGMTPYAKAKHKLKWNEANIFRLIKFYKPFDFEIIANSTQTLKIVSDKVDTLDRLKVFQVISKAADTLEDIDIELFRECNRLKNIEDVDIEIEGGSVDLLKMIDLKQLKLKRLKLEADAFEDFPYTLDTDKLKELHFLYFDMTKSLLESLTTFKRLVRLSLIEFSIPYKDTTKLIDAVTSLKELRLLALLSHHFSVDDLMLNKIMENLINLEILELEWIRLENQLLIPKRKLKVLTCSEVSYATDLCTLTRLAHRIGTFHTLDGLMTIISTTPTMSLFSEAVEYLVKLIYRKNVDLGVLIEAEKNGIFNFRSKIRLTEPIRSKAISSSACDLQYRMICYGLSNDVYFDYLRDMICDFLERNEFTNLAKEIKKYASSNGIDLGSR